MYSCAAGEDDIHPAPPDLEDGGLVDPLSVDVGLGLASARGHRHDALRVRDDAVARVDVMAGQLETLAARLTGPLRAHLSHVQVQTEPPEGQTGRPRQTRANGPSAEVQNSVL